MKGTDKFLQIPFYMVLLKALGDEKGETTSKIANYTGTVYPHVVNVKAVLVSKGLIYEERVGRTTQLSLTKTGREAYEATNKLIECLGLDYDKMIKANVQSGMMEVRE